MIFVIGREPDPNGPRIILQDRSISRTHATIAAVGNGDYMLHDTGSRNGTYVRGPGGWRRIEKAEVRPEDEIRLGSFVVPVSALLALCIATPGRARLERNPETGEIVRRPE